MSNGNFYSGAWYVPRFSTPVQQNWTIPLTGNLQNLKETSNIEELRANPEDFDLFPQETQAGINEWVTFTTPEIGGFYISPEGI